MSQEIKTLADLEALTTQERDAWFANKFGWKGIYEGDFGMIYAEDRKKNNLIEQLESFTTTNDGSAALKTEMIKTHHTIITHYKVGINQWHCMFEKYQSFKRHSFWCDAEIEATWKAAALALLGE